MKYLYLLPATIILIFCHYRVIKAYLKTGDITNVDSIFIGVVVDFWIFGIALAIYMFFTK